MESIIITGGTKGIGADIALKFLEEGYVVIIGSRNKDGIAKKKINNLFFRKINVKHEKDHRILIDTALKNSDRIKSYINCAGFSKWMPISEINEKEFSEMIDTNLKGALWGCKVAALEMKSGSSIINLSSLAGKRGSANNSLYCASKFALNGITQSLSKELGPKGIRVNAVCPVYVETESLIEALESKDSPSKNQITNTFLNDFADQNAALKRLPMSSEVADVCYFLSSSASSAITGQCINVDCGVLPQ